MATKKTDSIDDAVVYQPFDQNMKFVVPPQVAPVGKTLDDFAIAALQSVDWNQIGMGVDQAAKLCWSMAEAMVRNKP